MSEFTYTDPLELAYDDVGPLALWEKKLVIQARLLRQKQKQCIILVRFDGLAVQVFNATPVTRID